VLISARVPVRNVVDMAEFAPQLLKDQEEKRYESNRINEGRERKDESGEERNEESQPESANI